MKNRQWLPLLGLAFSAFMFNTSEFVPVGMLSDIASAFHLGAADAGMMISLYAWAVMLLSVPLMMLAARFSPRPLLLLVLTVFLCGQLISALAPSFALLVTARLVVACAHAVFWSIVSPLAIRIVDARRRSLAISTVATGSSIAMIFGMPLGRIIGLEFGWRMTFACVGAAALGALVLLTVVFPQVEGVGAFAVRRLPEMLGNPVLITIYTTTILITTASYTGYSYIEPFLIHVGRISPPLITVALMTFGFAGIIGSWLFSKLYDRLGTRFTTVLPEPCALWGSFAS